MRRTLVAAFATVASACSLPFGPDTPTCNQQITTSAVMFVQSVPGIEYVPCVDSMAAGWEFIHPEFRRGGALFTFDSDRWGSPFLQVELAAECDLGDAELVESDESVPRYMDVVIDTAVPITIVPEGLSAETRVGADVIADFLRERHIAGKAIDVTIDRPTSRRSIA